MSSDNSNVFSKDNLNMYLKLKEQIINQLYI